MPRPDVQGDWTNCPVQCRCIGVPSPPPKKTQPNGCMTEATASLEGELEGNFPSMPSWYHSLAGRIQKAAAAPNSVMPNPHLPLGCQGCTAFQWGVPRCSRAHISLSSLKLLHATCSKYFPYVSSSLLYVLFHSVENKRPLDSPASLIQMVSSSTLLHISTQ